jgi:competence protein ComEA
MLNRTLLTLALTTAIAGVAFAATPAAPTQQVNINTASAQELKLLPRVGPALAQRIVDFRAANGPFKAAEEIARVKGVGEKTFALLQPYVTLTGTTTLKDKVRNPRSAKNKTSKVTT